MASNVYTVQRFDTKGIFCIGGYSHVREKSIVVAKLQFYTADTGLMLQRKSVGVIVPFFLYIFSGAVTLMGRQSY